MKGQHDAGPWEARETPNDPDIAFAIEAMNREGVCAVYRGPNERGNTDLIVQADSYLAASQPLIDNLVEHESLSDDDRISVRVGDLRALNAVQLKALGERA